MACFLIIQDPDETRRSRHLRAMREAGPPAPGLVHDGLACDDIEATWWTAAQTPVAREGDTAGFAIVWGDALGGPADTFLAAADVRRAWSTPAVARAGELARVAPFDGVHAVVVYDAVVRRLVLGADLFGLIPIYYWADGDVMMAGSSPELFLAHPRFSRELDTVALAGLLLTERSVAGRTLFGGVRRVAGAHLLVRDAVEAPRELRQYRLVATDRHHGLAIDDQIALIDSETERCIRRQSKPEARQATLLSGGRDSRTVAGYLVDLGMRPDALTFGAARDHDAVCARRVARVLGLTQRLHDFPADRYPHFAQQLARWEHGTNGFGSVYGWGMAAPLAAVGDRFFTGYYLDALLSPPAALADPALCAFEPVWASHISRGLGLPVLAQLLRTDVFTTVLDELEATIRQTYMDQGDDALSRAWCFYLWERVRYMVGPIPWRMTFGAWPVLPALDRRWMDTMSGLPLALLVERRAQDLLLRRRFPQLSRTPIARPGDDTTPLEPGLLRRAHNALAARPTIARALATLRRVRRREHRFYYRINDFNGPGWQAIRRAAEPHRVKFRDLFDERTFAQLLPPPDTHMRFRDDLAGSSGLRTLVGLLLWAGRNL